MEQDFMKNNKGMKIIIDNSNLNVGGGIQVATSFLNDLRCFVNNDNLSDFSEIHVIQSQNSSKQIDKSCFSSKFYFYDLNNACQNSIFKRIYEVKKIEDEIKPDIIFTVFGPSYHKSKYPKIVGFAIPHLIYRNSPYFKKLNWIEILNVRFTNTIKSYCFNKYSDVLIFETDDAKDIYIKNNYIKSFTVNNTLNSIFQNPEKWQKINVNKSHFDILCLSANYPHKNLNVIPAVIDNIISFNKEINFKFHMSGDKNEFNFGEKYDSFINYLGKVDLNKIPELYIQMDCLFMPTLLEVFSTTYLEAMYMKIPIITSDMSFAKYICADSALYCSPLDSNDYSKNIVKLYFNHELREKLIKNGIINLERFGNSIDRSKKYLEIIKHTYYNENKR